MNMLFGVICESNLCIRQYQYKSLTNPGVDACIRPVRSRSQSYGVVLSICTRSSVGRAFDFCSKGQEFESLRVHAASDKSA